MLPFFVNKLDNLPCRHKSVASLQLSVGDVLGNALLSENERGHAKKTHLWDLVVLSNYMIDVEWLLSDREAGRILQPEVTKAMVILSGERDEGAGQIAAALRRCQWRDVTFGSMSLPPKAGQVTLITPHLPVPYGTHHTKAAVCISADFSFVRVAIFTANFVYADWRCKNQGIYVQDFPSRRASGMGGGGDQTSKNSFEYDLARYFTAAGWRGCAAILSQFDFTSAVGHIVASVPGYHSASIGPNSSGSPLNTSHWGLWHLRHQLKQHVPHTADGDQLTWQYTSQGSLTTDFLASVTSVMLTKRDKPFPSSSSISISNGRGDVQKEVADVSVSVVIPTITEVRRSVEGWRGGTSIPIPSKNLHEFINQRLHRWCPKMGESGGWSPAVEPSSHVESVQPAPRYAMTTFGRHRYMPHIKTYLRYSSKKKGTADWFLLTSSNLSRAAWGDVQKKGAQLMIRSYELGILFTPRPHRSTASSSSFLWEVKGIAKAHDNREAALDEGLHRVVIKATTESSSTTNTTVVSIGGDDDYECSVVYLPYDATNPTPYDSTVALREGKTYADAPRDAPWVVDLPHEGLDLLGFTYRDVVDNYSHYGAGAVNAPLLQPPTNNFNNSGGSSPHVVVLSSPNVGKDATATVSARSGGATITIITGSSHGHSSSAISFLDDASNTVTIDNTTMNSVEESFRSKKHHRPEILSPPSPQEIGAAANVAHHKILSQNTASLSYGSNPKGTCTAAATAVAEANRFVEPVPFSSACIGIGGEGRSGGIFVHVIDDDE